MALMIPAKSQSENRRGLSRFSGALGGKWDCPLLRDGFRIGSKPLAVTFSLFVVAALLVSQSDLSAAAERPNILWITSEDHGPHMGCYGDRFATTPNVDRAGGQGHDLPARLVERPGLRPARTTLISGMYARSTGSEHMRSMVRLSGRQADVSAVASRRPATTARTTPRRTTTSRSRARSGTTRRARRHWRNRAAGPAVLRRVQFGEEPREPDPQAAAHGKSTIRPRCACRPITPTRPRCARIGPSTTTSSARPTPTPDAA